MVQYHGFISRYYAIIHLYGVLSYCIKNSNTLNLPQFLLAFFTSSTHDHRTNNRPFDIVFYKSKSFNTSVLLNSLRCHRMEEQYGTLIYFHGLFYSTKTALYFNILCCDTCYFQQILLLG